MTYSTNYIYGDDACVGYYAGVLYVAFSVIGFLLVWVQVVFLQELALAPVYLLPLLTFCVTYENAVMYYSCNASGMADTATVAAGYVFNALIPSLFVLVLYEITFRLHEARQAHFFCLPMEQGGDVSSAPAVLLMWLVRLIAAGLFIMGILVNFSIVSHSDAPHAGSGGYTYLAQHDQSLAVWLALIPPITVSAMTLCMSLALHRYGKYSAMGLINHWKFFWLAAACLVAGYCFSDTVYPVTSNAGELALLLGLTFIVHLVQTDLGSAAEFADFLHQSNQAFQPLPAGAAENMARRVEEEMEQLRSRGSGGLELTLLGIVSGAGGAGGAGGDGVREQGLDFMVKKEMRELRGGTPSFSVDLESDSLRSTKIVVRSEEA